ncbi:hypothetical protein DL96DRAFT_1608593 [Flagelloscypha sp. PMI_526]|nr:hypothetical protein DL96DRAFT_1608593 [Flagelloscypha sp. PMI_526]
MFDVYCVISGVATFGGPKALLPRGCKTALKRLSSGLAKKLSATRHIHSDLPPDHELRIILESVLKQAVGWNDTCSGDICGNYHIIPESFHSWNDEVVVIGMTDVTSDTPIQLQHCRDWGGFGAWRPVLVNGEWDESTHGMQLLTDIEKPYAVFMDTRCWHYLQSWIQLPPRSTVSSIEDPEEPLYSEFWKLIKDDLDIPRYTNKKLDYGPMRLTWGQHQDEIISGTRRGVENALDLDDMPNLARAISSGLQCEELGPALISDFQL